MKRLGNHRLRPERSSANRARAELNRLDGLIGAAKGRCDQKTVDDLEQRKAWLLINSLTS